MTAEPSNIKSIFLAASEKPPAERAAFLEQAVGNDSALRMRVEALLKAHDNPDSFLEDPAAQFGATIDLSRDKYPLAERPGTLIGPYKLLEQIGEGGMGVVYMADQQVPVRRRVALKIIKAGMDTRQVIARFEAERQALALMDHSNIARVLDAGATDTGRPYFVMELVRGIPITEYCDQNNLPVHERLELFVQVCHAVQHAHQKGIIHRDLKPTNVLVTLSDGRPVPKVIDFGVAKATGQQLTEKTLFTAFAQMVGTPLYMSPEQAEMTSVDIDTRSDIYSLGVLLYELLTGTTPFDQQRMRSAAFDEIRRIIREEEPPKPSTRPSSTEALPSIAANRRLEPKKLSGLLQGELDWIVMKCLEKDRKRRYETANALAIDLQRYFNDEPVEARPATKTYRLRKFIHRNKAGVMAGAAIVTALAVGLMLAWISLIQARREAIRADREAVRAEHEAATSRSQEQIAKTQAAKSQQVATFMKDMLSGAGPSVALGRDTTMLREILDDTAQRLDQELADQPEVQSEMQYTIGKVYLDLNDRPKAEQMFRRALTTRRKLFGNTSQEVAETLEYLGCSLWRSNEYARAEEAHREALVILRQLHAEDHPDVAQELIYLGVDIGRQGHAERFDESLGYLRQGLEILRKKKGSESEEVASALQLMSVALQERVASPQEKDRPGTLAEIERLRRESVAISRKIHGGDHPHLATSLVDWGMALSGVGKFAEAVAIQQEALAMVKKLRGPENSWVAMSLEYLGVALKGDGKPAEAEAAYRESVTIITKLEIDNWWARDAGRNLIRLLKERGELAEAERTQREIWKMRQKKLGMNHPDTRASLSELLDLLRQQGKTEEAEFESLNKKIESQEQELQLIESQLGVQNPRTLAKKLELIDLCVAARRAADANRMVDHLPPEFIEKNAKAIAPLLQAMAYSSGGEKNWQRCADLFEMLFFGPAKAGVNANPNDVSLNYLEYAPVLVELDDRERYEQLREFLISKYGDSKLMAVAERSLMACLLRPANDRQMVSLEKWSKVAATTSPTSKYRCWDYAVLSLFEHRRGNHSAALDWGKKCLSSNPPPTCLARGHILVALAYLQLHRTDEAREDLAQCRVLVEKKFTGVLGDGTYETGLWKDWLIDRVLLREADQLLAGQSVDEQSPTTGSDN